ncbi:sensor histidine kinase [Streptomyces sp. V4I2]|uniref:sensor histidine kinase n=1 Tax=Streptomyces sp. V4I2 TaxID=3042280 RepID=UPI002785F200|nr:histidine kinase [Streptomyces sp. V4I2]MDQ1050224.1 signal transduction histidine kinase [Streptomyces sp. V4I2]
MIDNLQRLPSARPHAVDAGLAAALFACSLPGSLVTLPGHDPGIPWWPGVLLTGVACAALLWRRGRPRTTTAVTIVCATAVAALGYILTVLLLGPLMVALHSLAVRTDRRTANTFAGTGIALLVGASLLVGPGNEPLVLKLLGPTAWLLLPTSLGTVTRLRGAYLEAVQARAEHAERTREEEARRRVTEERMRIARDLHDVVAHHLVLANLQAGAVARMLPARPDEAERIVRDLSGTTSSALRELKSTVGLLRDQVDPPISSTDAEDRAAHPADGQDGTTHSPGAGDRTTHSPGAGDRTAQPSGAGDRTADPSDTGKPPAPTPGLAQLPDLASSFQHAGLTVSLATDGDPRPLSAGAALTAYRIVQEALTNVTKHAVTGSAEVRLAYTHDRLVVTVVNADAVRRSDSSSPGGGGYGLMGMRERAHSVGGRIRMGHRPQGGFEVVAELPVQPYRLEEPAAT